MCSLVADWMDYKLDEKLSGTPDLMGSGQQVEV